MFPRRGEQKKSLCHWSQLFKELRAHSYNANTPSVTTKLIRIIKSCWNAQRTTVEFHWLAKQRVQRFGCVRTSPVNKLTISTCLHLWLQDTGLINDLYSSARGPPFFSFSPLCVPRHWLTQTNALSLYLCFSTFLPNYTYSCRFKDRLGYGSIAESQVDYVWKLC